MKKFNKDNAQHIAGLIVGFFNRYTGRRYSKAERGAYWFSTVAANAVANRDAFDIAPYN